jgi:hypothetical protein
MRNAWWTRSWLASTGVTARSTGSECRTCGADDEPRPSLPAQMSRPFLPAGIVSAACLVALTLLVGCSDSDPVTQPPETPGGEILDPVPDGMPLPGDPEDPATGALVNLAPSAVPESEVQGTLLTTRLRAILEPDATVQQVNEALAEQGAAIVSMNRGVPIVVLAIDPVAGLAEAEQRAAALAQTPAFQAVFPARSFTAPAAESARPSAQAFDLPEGVGDDGPADHLVKTRVPAAWNVRDLNSADVTVLIADHFPDRSGHSGIDPLQFSFYGGFGNDAYTRNGTISGNEGIHSAGIIGGNWDTELPGIHPGSRLRIVGIPLGGLDLWEVSSAIYDELSSGTSQSERTVLLTGLTYREADMEDLGALERASLALGWRLLVRSQVRNFESDLLHIVPGGDRTEFDGPESPLGTDTSYWSVAARYADLRTYLLSLDPTDEEVQDFDALIEETGGASQSPLDNVLIIGGSKADGSPLPNGALLTDVRTYGEFVLGPCVLEEAAGTGVLCDGTSAAYVGTFAAAPQVAGLGAYLWSLAPTRSSQDLRDVLLYSYHGGFVDAYRSVLALDPNFIDPRVREMLLDPNEDGRFDETDIEEFREEFAAYQRFRELGYDDPDFSRYDLNGDGYTGSDAGVPFDLDADRSFGTVAAEGLSSSFDESASSDLDVLCYCAYSDLYFGDPDGLASLLPECGEQSGLFVQLTGVPERADPGQEVELIVTVGYNGSDQPPLEGISISFELDGAEAEPSHGETDAAGTFRTTVTYGHDDNEFEIGVWAETDEEEVYTEQTTLRNNSVELVERYVYLASEILAIYVEEGEPGVDLIREYSYVEWKGDAPIDTILTETGSGQGLGMIVSGTARATLKTEVSRDGGHFAGISFSSESRGRVTLTNPNLDLLLYQVDAEGIADVTIDFIVWGEPASFALDGAVSSADYVVDLYGPGGTVFECASSDAPCATIGESGPLPPGSYSLTINHVNDGRIRWNPGCTDCQSSGTSEAEGTLDVEFSVSH